MQQRLFALCRAIETATATCHGLVGTAHDARAANRTACRHDEFARPGGTPIRNYPDDLGNDVASAAHDDHVADAHVLAPNLVLVVQRGVVHRDAADKDRREARHRRQRPGTADLNRDIEQFGDRLLGGKLVRDGKARRARKETKAFLGSQIVELVDHAIDIVGQRSAPAAHVGIIGE